MMKLYRMLALMLAVMLLGAAAMAEPVTSAELGKEAPDFEIELLNGETFRLSDHRGKVVFLNIWATWCPPCVAEMPDIQKLADAYPDDLVVIGVSCDESAEDARAFVEEQGYTYNIAVDQISEEYQTFLIAGALYPSYAIPNSIFINPEGVVTSMEMGAADYETLEQRYLEALGEQ